MWGRLRGKTLCPIFMPVRHCLPIPNRYLRELEALDFAGKAEAFVESRLLHKSGAKLSADFRQMSLAKW